MDWREIDTASPGASGWQAKAPAPLSLRETQQNFGRITLVPGGHGLEWAYQVARSVELEVHGAFDFDFRLPLDRGPQVFAGGQASQLHGVADPAESHFLQIHLAHGR